MHDSELVEKVLSGDTAAFAALYDRYVDALYDFARGVLRNPDDAMDAVQDTFVTVSTRLDQLRDPAKLRPWLYSVARSHAYRKLRARKRNAGPADLEMMADDVQPLEQQAVAAELQVLLTDAALGLNDQDRQLIELHLRHDLPAAEIATVLGIRTSQASVRLTRVKDRVERSLGALLVARRGSEDCLELQGVLQGWDGRFNPLIRKRVSRHIDECDICSSTRSALVSPVALLSAVPLLAAPAALRETVLGDLQLIAQSSTTLPNAAQRGPKVTFRPSGFARLPGEVARRAAALFFGFSVFLGLGAGGVYVLQTDTETVAAIVSTTASSTTTTSSPSSTALAPTAPASTSESSEIVTTTSSTTTTITGPPISNSTTTTITAPVVTIASTDSSTSTSLPAATTPTSEPPTTTSEATTSTSEVTATTEATTTTEADASLVFSSTSKFGYFELTFYGQDIVNIRYKLSDGIHLVSESHKDVVPGQKVSNRYRVLESQNESEKFWITAFAYIGDAEIAVAWLDVTPSDDTD